ncbi:hypothetical protein LWC34_47295 [Kibdelosporangium philippinense]|uniref:Uncharacterized protein n=1 Tax=Kibdelosporangium philippinense TaxID=211113 RepID=A0ABS8ZUR0_9PSEU|nr:hypothetical protein [Kibdelosporangium philippinense]MCE7010361.1 hypothetical protein [Kibdelosporangium philippinense]
MVSLAINESGDSAVAMKLATDAWELNVQASAADFMRLREIDSADWLARRALAVGRCAGVPVFWVSSGGQVTILVGHDDQTWDIAVTVPLATVHKIVALAEQHEG